MNRNIFRIKPFALIVVIILGSFFLFLTVNAQYNYTPMEPIPGSEGAVDFPSFILGIYKFAIWTVGIAAVFMITIGGFMYLTSAGNTSKMDNAKKIIWDSIIGLVLALSAYLLLYIINPDLIRVNISLKPIGSLKTTKGIGAGEAGKCEVLPDSNPCGVKNLEATCFKGNAQQMSQICNIESDGGNPIKESGTDRCKDGSAWSVGLFQINMITSAGSVGCNGKEIFKTSGSGAQGECLEYKTNSNGLKYCAIRNCEVIDKSKYETCKDKLRNSQTNIQIACRLFSGAGDSYKPWINTAKRCGIN